MSHSARLHAARSALQAIERAARAGGMEALAELASLGLTASGETDLERARREKDATRKRDGRRVDVHGISVGYGSTSTGRPPDDPRNPTDGVRTASGHEGGVGGGVSPDPGSQREILSKTPTVGVQGEGPLDATRNPRAVRAARPITSEADDGHAGFMVGAWLDGISIATGKPVTRPVQGAIRQLTACLVAHAPTDGTDPCEWARARAIAYVEACRGRELSSFGFVRWMEQPDGPPVGPAAPGAAAPTTPEQRRQQDRAIEERVLAAARAKQADREQDRRADAARGRSPSDPSPIGGGP